MSVCACVCVSVCMSVCVCVCVYVCECLCCNIINLIFKSNTLVHVHLLQFYKVSYILQIVILFMTLFSIIHVHTLHSPDLPCTCTVERNTATTIKATGMYIMVVCKYSYIAA